MNLKRIKRACGMWEENIEASVGTLEQREGQKEVIEALKARKKFVLIYGASRMGKSWLLSAFGNDRIAEVYEEQGLEYEMDNEAIKKAKKAVIYMTFFDFELMLRTAQTKGEMFELYTELIAPKLLIIDEIGRGKWSEFTATFFQNLLIRRYGENKETWLASNLNIKEFADMFDFAVIERLRTGSVMAVKNG